jgi:hypothetical protein
VAAQEEGAKATEGELEGVNFFTHEIILTLYPSFSRSFIHRYAE